MSKDSHCVLEKEGLTIRIRAFFKNQYFAKYLSIYSYSDPRFCPRQYEVKDTHRETLYMFLVAGNSLNLLAIPGALGSEMHNILVC